MRMFVRAVRERWPMDRDDLDAAIARLQEIAGEDRGRVSWRARQALAGVGILVRRNPAPRIVAARALMTGWEVMGNSGLANRVGRPVQFVHEP